MLQLPDLKGRIARLEKLSRGLALEAALLKDGDGPLLYRERRAYLKAIQDALAGAEAARAALAGAAQRVGGTRGCQCQIRPRRGAAGAVPDFFIRFLTQPGQLVVDPFAGSNVTGQVAEGLARNWISIEINGDYVAGSRLRFAEDGASCALAGSAAPSGAG